METLKEITEIFEQRKQNEINDKMKKFNLINEEINLLKSRINELEEMKYKILLDY